MRYSAGSSSALVTVRFRSRSRPVVHRVNPGVYRQFPARAATPLDNRRLADVINLLDHVDLAEVVEALAFVGNGVQPGLMLLVEVFQVTQPSCRSGRTRGSAWPPPRRRSHNGRRR